MNEDDQDESINSFEESIFTSLNLFLDRCQFPRLRSLILQSFEAFETELLALLQGSPRLRSLTLSAFSLTRGSWEGFVEQARGTLNLKRVALHFLHGFDYNDSWDNYLDWHTPMVDGFFFSSGENPFSRSAMIQHKKDKRYAHQEEPWYKEHDGREYKLDWTSRVWELVTQHYGTERT